jgi:hypothetical protein
VLKTEEVSLVHNLLDGYNTFQSILIKLDEEEFIHKRALIEILVDHLIEGKTIKKLEIVRLLDKN